jgi:hypothetical protein
MGNCFKAKRHPSKAAVQPPLSEVLKRPKVPVLKSPRDNALFKRHLHSDGMTATQRDQEQET